MVDLKETSGTGKKKTTQGRKKIEIKKIESVSNRQVTFSKRRTGLFKKASELCILSGAQIAIIVHSEGKRLYSFGHPSADTVVDRFLGVAGGEELQDHGAVANTAEFNRQYSDVSRELEVEKKRKDAIEEAKKAGGYGGGGGDGFWWNRDVEGMGLEELEEYLMALEQLLKNVDLRANDLMISNSLLPASASHNPNAAVANAAALQFGNQNQNQNQLGSNFDFNNGINVPNLGFGLGQF